MRKLWIVSRILLGYRPLTRRCATFGGRRVSSTSTCQPRGGIATVIRMFIAATTIIPQLRFARAKRRKIDSHRTTERRRRSLSSNVRSQTARRRQEGSAGNARYCLRCLSSTRTVSTRRITDDSGHPVDRCVDCDSKEEHCEKRSILFFSILEHVMYF